VGSAVTAPLSSASTGPANDAKAAEIPLPDSVPDLIKLVAKDARIVVGVPSLDVLTQSLDPAIVKLMREGGASELAPRLGLSADLLVKVFSAFDGAVVFADGDILRQPTGAAIVRIKDESVIEPLLAAAKLEADGPDRWRDKELNVAWLAKAKVLVIAKGAPSLDRALALAKNGGASFADAAAYNKATGKTALWANVDLGFLGEKLNFGDGSKLVANIDLVAGSVELELVQNGEDIPRLGMFLAPAPQASLGSLPAGPVMAAGFSTKRATGKTLTDLLREVTRGSREDVTGPADAALQDIAKISLSDLDRGLGDEAAVGLYYEGPPIQGRDGLTKSGVALATVAIRDERVARSVVDAIAKTLRAKSTAGKFRFEKNGIALDVSTSATQVTIAIGARTMVDRFKAPTKTPLGAVPEFVATRKAAPAASSGLWYLDFPRLMKALPKEASAELTTPVGSALFALQLPPNERGGHYLLTASGGLGVVAGVGAVSAVGIYGVRRYLAAAKTSEAKNSLGAIGRDAIGAYERETGPNAAHALCKSAQQVPATVPSGKKYQSSDKAGRDYETGSATAGWKCLKFAMQNPQYFQYDYRAGGNYKGPKRGLPDPGKDGFEASAEGDLDGDGKTSLFTLTGKVVNGSVTLGTELNIADEFE